MNNKKGFTLIELLVVVLIIGILAAMAMPQYFKAVERSRMTEAVTLLGNIAQAQQRKYLQVNHYTENFRSLDVAPKGANGSIFYTKGDVSNGSNGNGFAVSLSATTFTDGIATAVREANGSDTTGLQYRYTLTRYYASNDTTCEGKDENGQALCMDFCGVDALTDNKCCSNGQNSDGTGSKCTQPVQQD